MRPVTILTVDDSKLSRSRFIAGPLRSAGYDVVEAVNGEEGLAAYAEYKPEVVISDLLMPVMDGFEFIAKLKELGATEPIIVSSADIQETSKRRVEELDTFAFLNKPFTSETLLAIVEEAVSSLAMEA